MTTVDQLMFEVEDRTVTLRVEEWATILTALELLAGGQADPIPPEQLRFLQRRILPYVILPDEADDEGTP